MTPHYDADMVKEALQKPAVMIDMWATWCGPCRMLAPTVDELAEEYDGRVAIGKVDVDEEGELAMSYGIESIPTLLFFKNGELVDKLVGLYPKDAIVKKLDSLL